MHYFIDNELKTVLDSWFAYLMSEKRYSDQTIRAYKADVASFLSFLVGHFEQEITLKILSDLSIGDFRSWLVKRKNDELEKSSVSRNLSTIRSLFRYFDRNEILKNQNIFALKTLKLDKPLPKALEEEVSMKVLDEIQNISKDEWIGLRDRAIVALIYGCGLRISEALSLKNSDIPSENSKAVSVQIIGKGKKGRTIPMMPEVVEIVREYINVCPFDTTEKLFFGKQGKPLNADVFRQHLAVLRNLYNLPSHTTPHAFRHSFATHLLKNSGDLRTIQELLGHQNIATTQKYTKITNNEMIDAHKNFHPRSQSKNE